MGGWLTDTRRTRGATAARAARDAGISQGYMTLIEQGARLPGVEAAQRIGREMGFDWRKFYGGYGR